MKVGEQRFRRNGMHNLESWRDKYCVWDEKSSERSGPGEPGSIYGPASESE